MFLLLKVLQYLLFCYICTVFLRKFIYKIALFILTGTGPARITLV